MGAQSIARQHQPCDQPIAATPPAARSAEGFQAAELLLSFPLYLLLNNDVPARSVAELVALGKARPGKLNMGSVGTGGAGHLTIEMFKNVTGISAVHVPYNGAGPAQVGPLLLRSEASAPISLIGESG